MNLIRLFQLRKTFFVLQDDEAKETRRNLTKQLFQLAYFGHISPEFASGLEISERSYIYELLVERLKEEKAEQDKESAKIKAASNKSHASTPHIRRGR
jgi:hypothetical protein